MRVLSPPPNPDVTHTRECICPHCKAKLLFTNLDIQPMWVDVDGYGTSDKKLKKGVRCGHCQLRFVVDHLL